MGHTTDDDDDDDDGVLPCFYCNFYGAASVARQWLVPAVADEPTAYVVLFLYSLYIELSWFHV